MRHGSMTRTLNLLWPPGDGLGVQAHARMPSGPSAEALPGEA